MGYLNEYLGFLEKVDKRIRNEKLTELIARAELTHRTDFTSKTGDSVPEKLSTLHKELKDVSDEFGFKSLNDPIEDEEHHTWSLSFIDSQGAERRIDWTLASSPEYRQMMSKHSQIRDYLDPPFLIEFAPKTAQESTAEEAEGTELEEGETPAKVKAEAKSSRRASRIPREPVEKQTARELFSYIVEQGKKDYDVQRYKGLGEMTAPQLWETTMDPERRTLLLVELNDIAETETIFTTLMGEDVEARRKFIEDNALDVKNLDI
jgi:DNA gyrase subunit B